MRVRAFLLSTCACIAVQSTAAVNLSFLKLRVLKGLPETASHVLNPSLASFSIETAFFTAYVGNATHPNVLTRNLLQNLKDRTGGEPAEVRIGGITADSTYYSTQLGDTPLYNFIDDTGALRNTTIGPAFWDALALLPSGTKITMNLDLHDLNYTGAHEVARATVDGLSNKHPLLAFELGNEPDHYLSFTAQNYTAIFAPWTRNISTSIGYEKEPIWQVAATAEDPLWPYDAPGAQDQLGCMSALKAGANKYGTIKSCSEHTYQYSVCDPRRAAVATLPNLVNHTRLGMFLDLWQPRIHYVRETLGPDRFVIGEYSSVSCSGRNNVSNTFGQALWLLDTTFYGASLNISRMHMHQGGPLALQSSEQLNHGGLSLYNMWYPVSNINGPVKVFPSYNSYMFVADTIGSSRTLRMANLYPGRQANGSTITPQGGDGSFGQFVAYGFWDQDDDYKSPNKLALLNLEIFNVTQNPATRPQVTIDISELIQDRKKGAKLRRLTAPGADVKDANVVTWAGQTYGFPEGAANDTIGEDMGLAQGKLVEETIRSGRVVVRASEAVLVYLR